jgi:hypothetical protein
MMRYFPGDFVLCVALAGAAAGPAFPSENPSPEDVERAAVSYRLKNAKQGYVRFRVVNKADPQPVEFVYETTFDAARIAQTRRARRLGQSKWGEANHVVVTPREYILDRHPKAVVERWKQAGAPKQAGADFMVLHPQPLGMDLNGADHLDKSRADCVLISPSARTPATITREPRDGLDAWRLDYKTKATGNEVSVWLAPGQGYGVIAAEYRNLRSQLVTSIRCRHKQYPAGGVWYPERLVKTIAVNGEVRKSQVVEVEEARFGGPVADAAFTLGSLGLKPGRMIGDHTTGQPLLRVWDGKRPVEPSEVPPEPPSLPPAPGWRKQALIAAAAGLGALALGCFLLLLRRRRAAAA